jgi:hypothetical protein
VLIIVATQEAEIIRGLWFEASLGKQFARPHFKKSNTK